MEPLVVEETLPNPAKRRRKDVEKTRLSDIQSILKTDAAFKHLKTSKAEASAGGEPETSEARKTPKGDFNIHIERPQAADFQTLLASFDLKRAPTSATHKSDFCPRCGYSIGHDTQQPLERIQTPPVRFNFNPISEGNIKWTEKPKPFGLGTPIKLQSADDLSSILNPDWTERLTARGYSKLIFLVFIMRALL
ncbi:uncharacterized protein LOC130247077 isoform X2 [Danio aesculapii]|uniref:uncharacterized protein LOC130247077 isoform X2 n=1 Tax=Danio aesculapii TaxID=1142201 RepID=UPI0024BF2F39|nr:uncharacterized protein LOC130247077 isoform X2 [Danio aesculapii]